jgi:hypothetical protein
LTQTFLKEFKMDYLNKQSTFTKVGLGAIIFGLIFMVSGAAYAAEPAAWTSVTAHGKLSNGMTLTIEEELRYTGVDMASQTSRHTDIAVGTSVAGLDVTLGHRNSNGSSDRNYVGVAKDLGTIAGWSTEVATAVELFSNDTVRNRTGFSATKNEAVAGFTPYLMTEFFLTDKGDLTSNRTTFGMAKSINASTAVDVWYQTDTDMAGNASATSAVGFGLNLSL